MASGRASSILVQIKLRDLERLRRAAEEREAPVRAEAAVPLDAPGELAGLPAEYLTTAEAAELLGTTKRALEALRARGNGPPFVRLGRSVRYRRSDLE